MSYERKPLHKRISHRTLFYIKEYGKHAHFAKNIIRESIRILLLASILSSIGGFGLETVGTKVSTIVPLLIILPALNTMIGSYGTITAGKLTHALFEGYVQGKWWKSHFVKDLFFTTMTLSIFSAIYIGIASSVLAAFQGFAFDFEVMRKIIGISLTSTIILMLVMFPMNMLLGNYIYRKKEDPNNFLIPISTSVADLGSLIMFTILVRFFF